MTSPRTWLVLLALACLLVAGIIWAAFTMVPTTTTSGGTLIADPGGTQGVEAVVFATATDARRIRPAMDARVEVQIGLGEQPIELRGAVTTVGRSAEDPQAMAATLRDRLFAQALVARGKVIPVHLRLSKPAGTSTPRLRSGLLTHATITLAKQSLISRLIP